MLTMKLPAVRSRTLSSSETQNVNDTSSYQKGEKNLSQRPEIHQLIKIKISQAVNTVQTATVANFVKKTSIHTSVI